MRLFYIVDDSNKSDGVLHVSANTGGALWLGQANILASFVFTFLNSKYYFLYCIKVIEKQ